MIKSPRFFLLSMAFIALSASLLSGCNSDSESFPEPGDATESMAVTKSSSRGPIVAVFCPNPLRNGSPPDGVRRAALDATRRIDCSLASFYWTERAMADRWLDEQCALRRQNGEVPVVMLAGHSLGATEAAEAERRIQRRDPETVTLLLVTVDAIKTGKIGAKAGVTGTVIGMASPVGKSKLNFTSYDSAPEPNGRNFLRHVNYYQTKVNLYKGSPMPDAENHPLSDTGKTLNHGNADDFAYPMILSDFRQALGRTAR